MMININEAHNSIHGRSGYVNDEPKTEKKSTRFKQPSGESQEIPEALREPSVTGPTASELIDDILHDMYNTNEEINTLSNNLFGDGCLNDAEIDRSKGLYGYLRAIRFYVNSQFNAIRTINEKLYCDRS